MERKRNDFKTNGRKDNMTLTQDDLVVPKAAWKAWKLSSTERMLEDLASSDNPVVRLGVAWNPNASSKTLRFLASDLDEKVSRAALIQRGEREANGRY